MSNTRHHARELIDRLPETQVQVVIGFLESIVEPDKATIRNAPFDPDRGRAPGSGSSPYFFAIKWRQGDYAQRGDATIGIEVTAYE